MGAEGREGGGEGEDGKVKVGGDGKGDGKKKMGVDINGCWVMEENRNGIREGNDVEKIVYWQYRTLKVGR
mgnify:CR=1 FL=1